MQAGTLPAALEVKRLNRPQKSSGVHARQAGLKQPLDLKPTTMIAM
jgi:hypothetical protein